MAILEIADDETVVRLATTGGAILDATHCGTPFLRPYAAAAGVIDMTRVGSFPFIPFGGRVACNAFDFDGTTYRLAANTAWDPLYLHGDAWLGEWTLERQSGSAATLIFDHPARDGAPYHYRARQLVSVVAGSLALTLTVENTGAAALPFGIGHHPFFPLTPETTLTLDNAAPQSIPMGPVDRSGEGWTGRASIAWPERDLALDIEAEELFERYVLYVPDNSFDRAYARDYFCFEPMSHSLDGQHRPDLGGLTILRPGEALAGTVRFRPRPL